MFLNICWNQPPFWGAPRSIEIPFTLAPHSLGKCGYGGMDITRAGSRGIARWRRFEEGVLRPFHRTIVLLEPRKPGLQCRKEEPQNLEMTRKLLYHTATWIGPRRKEPGAQVWQSPLPLHSSITAATLGQSQVVNGIIDWGHCRNMAGGKGDGWLEPGKVGKELGAQAPMSNIMKSLGGLPVPFPPLLLLPLRIQSS